MDKELIEVLSKHCTSSDKEQVVAYLIYKKRFYELLKLNNSLFNKELLSELLFLGKVLNNLKYSFESNSKIKNMNEYFYSLGVLSILNMNYIPDNFHDYISKQDYTRISSYSIEEVFKKLYRKYKLISGIYNINGELGLTKYIMINRDLPKTKSRTLYDLCDSKVLLSDEVLYLTSNESTFNNGKCYGTTKKLLKVKLLEKRNILLNEKNDAIHL